MELIDNQFRVTPDYKIYKISIGDFVLVKKISVNLTRFKNNSFMKIYTANA